MGYFSPAGPKILGFWRIWRSSQYGGGGGGVPKCTKCETVPGMCTKCETSPMAQNVIGVRVHQIDPYVCVSVWLAGGRARENFITMHFFITKKNAIFHQKKCDFSLKTKIIKILRFLDPPNSKFSTRTLTRCKSSTKSGIPIVFDRRWWYSGLVNLTVRNDRDFYHPLEQGCSTCSV